MDKRTSDKLFDIDKVCFSDLKNHRFISRKPIFDWIVQHQTQCKGRLLDIGCGSMEYRTLFTNIDEYIGLDVYGAEGYGFITEGVIYYDGETIPYEDNTFGAVLSIEMLYCCYDYEHMLNEIYRVLKPGGAVILTTPFAFPVTPFSSDSIRLSVYGLKMMMDRCGFEVAEIKPSTRREDTIRRMMIYSYQNKVNNSKGIRHAFNLFVWKIIIICSNLLFWKYGRNTNESDLYIDVLSFAYKPLVF